MNKVFIRRPLPSAILCWLALTSGFLSGCQWISESILDDRNTQETAAEPSSPVAANAESGTEEIEPVIPQPIEAPPSTQLEELADTAEAEPTELATPVAEIMAEAVAEVAVEEPSHPEPIAESEAETDLGIFDLCQEIGNKLGSVSLEDCLSQGFSLSGGKSVLGRPLAIKDYPELDGKEPLGRVLLLGGIHGDEFSAVSIVFKWMEILNEHHSGIFNWRFVPLGNPDGLLAENSTRQNYNGVDLNRNFPSNDWRELALDYWREKTSSNSRRFPGSAAGSEPEVQWLVSEIKEFQPDVIISVHAPYHLVDYDGPPEAPKRLGDLQLRRLGVFPGSLGNYAGIDLDMPVVTIELPYAGILPDAAEISGMWTDLVAWLVEERSKIADAD